VPLLRMKPSLLRLDDEASDEDEEEELGAEPSEEEDKRTAAGVVTGASLVDDDAAATRPVAGMQSDPPQVSPTGQQAVIPLNTHVGCAASHVTEQSPTPPEEKQPAPLGQHPDPSGHTVSVD